MPVNLFQSLPSNIIDKLNYLRQDFVGFNIDFTPIYNLAVGFAIALGLLVTSLFIGRKIRKAIFGTRKIINANYLIDIAFGYTLIGTGVAVLGLFSLLKPILITIYLVACFLFAFYPFGNLSDFYRSLTEFIRTLISELNKNKLVFIWVSLFVVIALINLVNLEIREDQYHVDFPKMYLQQQTIMLPPKEQLHVSASPMLSEMIYMLGIFLWSEESARYIHFLFYILVLLTLFEFSKIKGYKFSIYTPLLFATAPVVIHETSSMYTDFQWIYFFLLSILILIANKKLDNRIIGLSGVFLGAMLATKLWTIAFIPVSVIFLFTLIKRAGYVKILKSLSIFMFFILLASGLWFFRSYILTGYPFYPAFSNPVNLENVKENFGLYHYLQINSTLFNPLYFINVFSPLFFLGCILFLYKLKQNFKLILETSIFKLFILLLLLYIFINYPYGRYLLGLYVLFIFFASVGIEKFLKGFKLGKLLLNISLLILFAYYLISSLLIVPYAFGITNKTNYLTRVLSRDNSSYYDFGGKFDKYITKKDTVATYGIFGYYYANFKFIDVNYIFDNNHKDFNMLKNYGVTKLFIKGGNINYFCNKIELSNCNPANYKLISSYSDFPTYYLYRIK